MISTLREYSQRYAGGGLALARRRRRDRAAVGPAGAHVRSRGAGPLRDAVSQRALCLERLRRQPAARAGRSWSRSCPNRAPRGSKSHRRAWPDGTLLQVGKSSENREALLARFRTVLAIVSLVIVAARPGRRRDRHAFDAAADPPTDYRRPRHHPHRADRRPRAGPAPSAMPSTSSARCSTRCSTGSRR